MIYVEDGLESRVFGYFGVPILLQSDVTHIFGRPRHPQSQGLVEQSNGTIQNMLNAMMTQYCTDNWVKLLPRVMYNLNTQVASCM
jgi:hypothetical protein